ncbi:MAG: homocysteine S-methyltransferase family protein [Anaerolineae bacterium]
MRENILDRLASGRALVADGATGTMLQAVGLPVGTPPEAWVLERPEEIVKLHRAYIEAGSDIVLTTTFGGTRPRLDAARLEAPVAEISCRAAELARQAAGDDIYVAGDIGPTGEMMKPLGALTFESALEFFAEQAQALAEGGADLVLVETMSDLDEARAAVSGAKQACDLPVFCTFSFDTHGRTNMGVKPAQAAQALAELGVAAMGGNCGNAPEELLDILPLMRQAAPGIPLVAKPNAGIPRVVQRQVVYDATPERMAELAVRFVEVGAVVVGACCGSSPEHIAAIAAAVRKLER